MLTLAPVEARHPGFASLKQPATPPQNNYIRSDSSYPNGCSTMSERPNPPINYFRSSTLWKALCWSWWWAIALCVIRALASFSLPPWLNRPVYVAAHFSKEASSDFSQNDSKSEHALAAQQRNLIRHRSVLDQVMEIGELRAAPSLSNPATSEA